MRLRNKTVAVPVAEEFEDVELTEPVKSLESEGARVTLIGLSDTAKHGLVGQHGTVVTTDATIDEVGPDGFSALLIPGGLSPARLRGDERVLDFVRRIATASKPIAAISRGPQLLVSAGVAGGAILTGYPNIERELRDAGATYVDEPVEIDGNFVTSRYPADMPRFIEAMIRVFERSRERAA